MKAEIDLEFDVSQSYNFSGCVFPLVYGFKNGIGLDKIDFVILLGNIFLKKFTK